MLPTQRRDPRVMDFRTGNVAGGEQCTQGRPVRRRFGQERRGRRVDVRVRHDGKELMQAFPRDGPGRRPFRQLGHPPEGGFMERRFLAVRVDENVGIDGDQLPRPS